MLTLYERVEKRVLPSKKQIKGILSIQVSVKNTDADDLYMGCIHVAAVAEQIKEQQRMKKAS